MNGVVLQAFHWYSPDDGGLWRGLASRAEDLAEKGFTAVWLPPAYKGCGGRHDVGYGVYDMYDLGEFPQKGSVRTKYGTREEYLHAVKQLQAAGLHVYADAVLNHRMGADAAETVKATPFSQNDRLRPIAEPREIRAYTHFVFPGRRRRHSVFEWHWRHFDAVDHDAVHPDERGLLYLLDGKRFDDEVALERGNFSYLMGCDLDFQDKEVQREVTAWGKWYLDTTGVDGFRLDAVKHISAWFFPAWIDEMERHAEKDLFVVGEYWTGDAAILRGYLDQLGGRLSAFDVPLHYRFHEASRAGGGFDMRKLFDGTLTHERPAQLVTFVENHDSQPLQALESAVEPWFKPLAYATILLREQGYPCVFGADYDGAEYEDVGRDGQRHEVVLPSQRAVIDALLEVRRSCAWGPQADYFDHEHVVGWTRAGDASHPKALAVLMSDGAGGEKWMDAGRPGATFADALGHVKEPVQANEHGWAPFRCEGGSVSVWVEE
jgi:alpha-amylase